MTIGRDAMMLRALRALRRVEYDEWIPPLLAFLNKPVAGLPESEFVVLLEKVTMQNWVRRLGVYAWNDETFGPEGTLGRADTREVVLTRDLRAVPDERGDCSVNARLRGRESDGKMAP